MRCENCSAFHMETDLDSIKDLQKRMQALGECRANPRQVFMAMSQQGPQFVSVWPSVKRDQWCREFRPKETLAH